MGADNVEELLGWCHDIGIRTITLYVLSTENLERSRDELEELFSLFRERFERLLNDERLERWGIRVKALGRLDLLSPDIRDLLHRIEIKTQNYTNHFLNIAIAYGGRAEIVDSVRKINNLGSATVGNRNIEKVVCVVLSFDLDPVKKISNVWTQEVQSSKCFHSYSPSLKSLIV